MILDGEVVAFDDDGRPSFELLQSRMHLASDSAVRRRMRDVPVTYVVFDLLWLEGHSTLALPYRDRRTLLAAARARRARAGARPRTARATAGAAEASTAQGLEGIVAKRLDCAYEPGPALVGAGSR